MQTAIQIALTACAAELITFGEIADAAEDVRKGLFAQASPGMVRLSRLLITAGQRRTQKPKAAKPLSPEVFFGEAVAKRPALNNFG